MSKRVIELQFEPFARRDYPGDTEMMEPELYIPVKNGGRVVFSVTPTLARFATRVATIEDLLSIQSVVADELARLRGGSDAQPSEE